MREITKSLKFRGVGPTRWWRDALQALARIAWFLPPSLPAERSSLDVTSKFRP